MQYSSWIRPRYIDFLRFIPYFSINDALNVEATICFGMGPRRCQLLLVRAKSNNNNNTSLHWKKRPLSPILASTDDNFNCVVVMGFELVLSEEPNAWAFVSLQRAGQATADQTALGDCLLNDLMFQHSGS